MPVKESHFVACLAATVISACGGLSVADEPATPAANPPSDKWVAPPAVSPAIEIPRNVPERDPATPAVSSTSDPAGSTGMPSSTGISGEATVPGPEVPRNYESLSRATDRRYSITTFNNLRRGLRRVYVVCKQALTPPAHPVAPAQ